jgi:hypothetical protein
MANNGNRNVWEHRDLMESRLSKMEAHMENMFHHLKRIDSLLEKQNGRVRVNEFTISKWRGLAIGVIALSTAISTIITIIIQ